jgi:hypothetical protein
MVLNDDQKKAVAAWIDAGAKPAEVQAQLDKEFGLRLTYMEVRLLIDDLKVMPKDPAPAQEQKEKDKETPAENGETAFEQAAPEPDAPPAEGGKVSVKVDSIMKPGTMMSGSVVFSDGKRGEWYLDQYGRLGMVPPEPGYRPAQPDLMAFQSALEREFSKMGY